MKKFSIFGIITFMFIMAAIAVVIGYNYNKKYEKEKSKDALNQRYAIVTSSTLYRLISSPLDEDFVNDLHDTFHVNLIINPALRKKIEKESEVLETRKTRIGSGTILYYKERDNNYLLIKSANGSSILVEDTVYKKYVNKIHTIKYIFLGFGLLLFIVYFVIIRKLRPVKKLKSEIDKFANGNLNINCKIDGDDEIAELANAFNHSVEQIRKLNSSRKLFLRNIMHELKTPITKGMITVEMIEDGKQKDRLISTFQRLENLLNEFAAIEQISVDDKHLTKRVYRLIDAIDEAIDISMVDPELIHINLRKNLNLKIDFKLFSIAIKNMIDNGIKYSHDKQIHISADLRAITFSSVGTKLVHDLSYYIEPFTKGSNKSAKSFGLGLYIVDSILKAHDMQLTYNYSNGHNIFKFIKFKPIE